MPSATTKPRTKETSVDGIHDCGGMSGFGPVHYRAAEPVFSYPWEGRTLALLTFLHIRGISQWDKSRWFREMMGNEDYVTEIEKSYYTHWLSATERLLVEAGIITEAERVNRVEAIKNGTYQRSLPDETEEAIARQNKDLIEEALAAWRKHASLNLEGPEPSFKVGDEVVVRRMNPPTHTRCPKYVRGVKGRIVKFYGCQIYPDSAALDQGPDPKPLYSVEFSARDVWGEDGHPSDTIYVDMWEPYLAPVA